MVRVINYGPAWFVAFILVVIVGLVWLWWKERQ